MIGHIGATSKRIQIEQELNFCCNELSSVSREDIGNSESASRHETGRLQFNYVETIYRRRVDLASLSTEATNVLIIADFTVWLIT